MYKNLSNKKLSSFYRICEIFTISLCKFSFGESPQRETLLGRFNKIDPESALRKPFVLTAILYSYFYLKYLRGSNMPQEIFCPDSCQNPLKFPPWKTFDWYLLSALDKGHRTGYQPKKNKHLLNPFHTGFLNFLKSTQNEAELRKELNQTAEADNLGVKPITGVSQATANTIHKWNNTNTNTQIHKYNLVKFADRPNKCYIFEKEMVPGPQKQCAQVSHMQIHNTNTQIQFRSNLQTYVIGILPNHMGNINWPPS